MKIQIRTRHGFARSLALPALISIVLVSFGLSLAACGKGGTAGDENAAAKDSTGSTGGNTAATGDGDHKTAAADTGAANGKPSEKKERPVSVDASAAIRGDLVVPVSAEGAVRSLHSAEIKVEISGRIAAIAAKEGQSIKKGSLILRLDSREYEVAADEARSRYLQALSALAVEEDSVGSVERPSELQQKIRELEKLEKQGSITREERLAQEISLDVQALRGGAFRTDMAATRSGVTAARAAVERAYLNLERTEIRAPFSGVVSGLRLSTGEQMMAGQTVCSLVNNIELEAVVGVLEADIGHLEKGGRALIVLTALDDTLETQIGVISPQFDRSTRTCDVLLPISNSEGRVRPGMFVRAIIAGETLENRLLVPREAILTRDGRPLLFKVENDRAMWLYVELGRQNDSLVEIKQVLQGGSLAEGDLVVVSNHLTLSHDAKIEIKNTIPVRDPWDAEE
jgi:RND family efflux transporter MFP subunit